MNKLRFRLLNALQKIDLWPVPWRRRMLRAMGLDIAQTAIVMGGCHFNKPNVSLAEGVMVNTHCYFDADAPISLGRNVQCGHGVRFVTATHAIGAPDRRAGDKTELAVAVHEGAWLGAHATLLPGVVVARGCVIGAGAVVTRPTAPNGLYAGSPARKMRSLGEARLRAAA